MFKILFAHVSLKVEYIHHTVIYQLFSNSLYRIICIVLFSMSVPAKQKIELVVGIYHESWQRIAFRRNCKTS